MKQIFETYLQKEMDRKEFLKQIGFLFLAVLGVSSILKYLAEQSGHSLKQRPDTGYGSRKYGGMEKT